MLAVARDVRGSAVAETVPNDCAPIILPRYMSIQAKKTEMDAMSPLTDKLLKTGDTILRLGVAINKSCHAAAPRESGHGSSMMTNEKCRLMVKRCRLLLTERRRPPSDVSNKGREAKKTRKLSTLEARMVVQGGEFSFCFLPIQLLCWNRAHCVL